MTEVLEGYKRRCDLLQVPYAEMAVMDNCCQVRSAIKKALPDVHIVLDVYHMLKRYAHIDMTRWL